MGTVAPRRTAAADPPGPRIGHNGRRAPSCPRTASIADPFEKEFVTASHPTSPASPPTASGTARRPSVKDVARLAGVSVGTVSNVVNGRTFVRAEARERVEAAIAELGFVRNATAKALRTGVSPLVGVAVLDLANPFFMEAATGMERRLNQDGCVMALSSTHSDVEEEARLLHALAGQGVRGILLTPSDTALTVAHEVVGRGIPVVLFDSPATPPDMPSISVDDQKGAELALTHLLELGHRRIAFLNGPRRVRQARDRLAGVRRAVSLAARRSAGGAGRPASRRPSPNDKVDLVEIPLESFTANAARDRVHQLLLDAGIHAGPAPRPLPASFPTAFFCANDLIAFGAMTALRDAGVRVPTDVSLVGFDDIPMASEMSVPLTTIRQPMEELGWAAAEALFATADGAPVGHRKFLPSLVERASAAPPPDRPDQSGR
jgi:LacI family transcriptional regulator